MPKHNEPKCWISIKTKIGEVEVTGAYSLDKNGWLTVRMDGGGTKQARGGNAAESTARLILSELFRASSM